jgi:alpha,alpha-trehalase
VIIEKPIQQPTGNEKIYYYWDTYWIIRGLLHSELYDTAKGILRNFAVIVQIIVKKK